jgi:hypothetical protein
MGMMDGLNDVKSLVQYGSRGDICVLCLRETAAKDKVDYAIARNRLKGQLEGKQVVKLRVSGSDVAICLDHIHKIAKEFPVKKGDKAIDKE